MNTKMPLRRPYGMTLLETLVVMVLLAILVGMLAPAFSPVHAKSPRISCINNLKQIGTAYRIWENDNGDKYPMQQLEALGGMQGIFSNSISAGRFAYLPYALMANEMGQSPRVVVCPSDERVFNTNFYWGPRNAPKESGYTWPAPEAYGSFDNTNVSYFCGVGAADTYPQSVLGGDRNLGNGGVINTATGEVRSPEQDPFYGISGTTANPEYPCGADAIVNTNGQWSFSVVSGGGERVGNRSQAVAWSAKMHSAGNIAGAGNILLGDGSAQQCTSASLRKTWLRNAADSGNFATNDMIHTTANGSIRFIFP
ncbi:MAG: type II secretion system protein [Verrucomicrobiota bacterium]|jgi:prepilin-type N-terminal cleavage/methylation domain-containing protein